MNHPAVISLAALIIAIVLSMVSRVNVGVVSMAFAWVVGTFVAGQSADTIVKGFPASLFLTLTGMTLLFAAAESNGTLERLAARAISLARGRASVVPIIFFLLSGLISSVGPGSVSTVALVAPLAMAIGYRAGVPPFLTALMVANGANAGNLSPVSAVGVIVNTKMAAAGLGGHEAKVFLANFLASALVGLAGYFMLGGHRLTGASDSAGAAVHTPLAFEGRQRLTAIVLALWIVSVLAFSVHLGFSAIVAVSLIVAVGACDETIAIKRVPWGVILMVCGVSTLIALLESTGGMELFTAMLAHLATGRTINGAIAFVTGAISIYSSTSGVVLPAFLPTVPGLVGRLGGGDPVAVSLSINVGSSLVDVSPLSTLGALCLAALPAGGDAKKLFRQLMIWGFSMAIVGALFCQLFAGVLARM